MFVLLVLAMAQEPRPLLAEEGLAGWRGDPDVWHVEAGELVGRPPPGGLARSTWLVWEGGEPCDFELEFEVRLAPGANSGVQLRGREVGAFAVAGLQVDLAEELSLTGGLYDQFGRGLLARPGQRARVTAGGELRAEPLEGALRPALARVTGWRALRVRATGPRVDVWLDGRPCSTLVDASPLARASGRLALQLHSGSSEVRFRGLVLRDLGGTPDRRPYRTPQWIWTDSTPGPGARVRLRRTFEVTGEITGEVTGASRRPTVFAAGEADFEVHLDGRLVLTGEGPERLLQRELAEPLEPGQHVLTVRARGRSRNAACLVVLRLPGDGPVHTLVSDGSWQGRSDDAGDDWRPVHAFGPPGIEPWPLPRPEVWREDGGPTPAERLTVEPGYSVELVHAVPQHRGSWVALAFGPSGRAVAADGEGALYRVDPSVPGLDVERLEVDLGHVHGLAWQGDALFAVVGGTGRWQSGLYRLFDADGDDRFEHAECLRGLEGGGEHGPHAVLAAPDGRSLVVLGGYGAFPPSEARSAWGASFAPVGRLDATVLQAPADDVELTAHGELLARGAAGFVCRVEPEPSGWGWTLVATGLRNPFGAAFDADGALHVFDNDFEWDLGTPWYVPARLLTVVAGADFGFRLGPARWPSWVPDTLGARVEVGRAAPTGMVAGAQLAFPGAREHLFAGDWTGGRIVAFDLAASTWRTFLSGPALPVTALAADGEGALWFATGGRGAPSGLYRVTAWAPVPPSTAASSAPRGLEPPDDPIARLASDDAAVRARARRALEARPFETWGRSVPADLPARARDELRLSTARVGPPEAVEALLAEWSEGDLAALDEEARAYVLRTLEHALLRATPADAQRCALARAIAPLLARGGLARGGDPAAQAALLLAHLGPEGHAALVPWALERLESGEEPGTVLPEALLLRRTLARAGPDERERFFRWLAGAERAAGGEGRIDYLLSGIRRDALAALDEAGRAALGELAVSARPDPAQLVARPLLRAWRLEDFAEAEVAPGSGRDVVRGRRLLREAGCLACHRIAGAGTPRGPDLDRVGRRQGFASLLASLLEPSHVVPARFRDTRLTLEGGTTVVGRIESEDPDTLVLRESRPSGHVWRVPRAEVRARELLELSPMPAGLLDGFTREEVLDLVAALMQDA